VEPLRLRMRVRFGGTWIADSDDVPRTPRFMVCSAAKWMTGASIRMDGGEIKGI
jgi:NAD(P)-dependent dehydrogenase (short-subunit alcohol dehydrogenase family)